MNLLDVLYCYKVKFNPSHVMKAQRESRWGWVVNALATLPQKMTGYHCTGGCVGLRAALDGCRKPRPHRDSNPAPPSP